MFLKKKKRGNGFVGEGRWEKLGGVEGEETVVEAYCMREKSVFDKKKKSKTFKILIIYFKREFEQKYPAWVDIAAVDDKGN